MLFLFFKCLLLQDKLILIFQTQTLPRRYHSSFFVRSPSQMLFLFFQLLPIGRTLEILSHRSSF